MRYVLLILLLTGCDQTLDTSASVSPVSTATPVTATTATPVAAAVTPTPTPTSTSTVQAASTTTTTTTTATTPTPAATTTVIAKPSATLKQTVSCTDSQSFSENQWVSFDYQVSYTHSTYSDGSEKVSCGFGLITLMVSNFGGCNIPLASDNRSNLAQTYPWGSCSSGFVPDAFFSDMKCVSLTSVYTYSFDVAALAAEGYSAKSFSNTISHLNCTTTNF